MGRKGASSTNSDYQFIMDRIREFGGIDRLGHVFQTRINSYYYDSGTGKVILEDHISVQMVILDLVKRLEYVHRLVMCFRVLIKKHLIVYPSQVPSPYNFSYNTHHIN